ncbi:DoxX family protein [Flavihumibacter sp. UBA7668]|uniref:DoxX family protein n=1 Tax=Flavihumibacter sp. UBA7668 TaxID=1946542 RepID=UPI0025C6DA54|nr:DoxX family membrane protein [Flavihumibacter sp. UBA7668]
MSGKYFSLFRILTSLIFVYAGLGHVLSPDKMLIRLSKSTLYKWLPYHGLFEIVLLISGVVMLAAAILLILNRQVKWAALTLLLVLISITLSVQLENLQDLGPFFKNVAIAGSLILLINSKKDETT